MIREAVSEDAAAIAAFWNPLIRETTVTFTTAEKSVQQIADLIANTPHMLVCELHGQPVGFARYGPFRGGPGYRFTAEHTVILSPDARGAGYGRALMTELMDRARSDGLHSMIGAISAENTGAVDFHAAIGFHKVAVLPQVGFKFDRRIDLVLMQKML